MTSILVVDDDDLLRTEVAGELQSHGYDVSEAASVDEALRALGLKPFDVLITDLRMDGQDGIDLLAAMRAKASDTRAVLMSGFATAKDYQTATDLGAVRVLTKPFTPRELLDAIQHAVDSGTGFHGSVHGLSLVDMLQMFHFGQRDIVLHIGGKQGASIELRGGEVVHAVCGELTGVEALRAILAERSGAVQTAVPRQECAHTITQPFQSLLMDTLREIDESAATDDGESMTLELGEDAFAEWSSTPPARGSLIPTDQLRGLAEVLDRLAPRLGALVVNLHTKARLSIRQVPSLPDWVEQMSAVLSDARRVLAGGECHELEYVTDGIAVAVLHRPEDGYMLLLESDLRDQFAVQRFRSQVRQVANYLPVGTTQAND